jgi:hypothetical protein
MHRRRSCRCPRIQLRSTAGVTGVYVFNRCGRKRGIYLHNLRREEASREPYRRPQLRNSVALPCTAGVVAGVPEYSWGRVRSTAGVYVFNRCGRKRGIYVHNLRREEASREPYRRPQTGAVRCCLRSCPRFTSLLNSFMRESVQRNIYSSCCPAHSSLIIYYTIYILIL